MKDQATIQTLLEEADRVAERAIAFGPCDDIRPVDVRHALDDIVKTLPNKSEQMALLSHISELVAFRRALNRAIA